MTKNQKPKFSILMANYNNGKYITEAVQSVLNQTSKDWELLIIDDCSTDNSLEEVESFLSDERVRLLKNEANLGYIGTLKRLINEARADIVGILDSDDVLVTDAVETMLNAYKNNSDYGFIYSQFMYCDSNLNSKYAGYCKATPQGKTNLQCDYVSHFKTFKKADYLKTEGYDEEILYAEDKDLTFKMEEITKLLFIDKILYYYRGLSNSQGNDFLKAPVRKASFVLAKFNAFIRRKNMNIQNLTKKEMIKQLLEVAFFCAKHGEMNKSKDFLFRVFKL